MNDIEFHRNTDYYYFWQSMQPIELTLTGSFNVRIFDRIFDKIYYRSIYEKTLFLADHNKYSNSDYSLIKNHNIFTNYDNITFVLRHHSVFSARIYGYYTVNNKITYCSIPHAKTLINSYNNNPKDTIDKLFNITKQPNIYKLINLASKLCR